MQTVEELYASPLYSVSAEYVRNLSNRMVDKTFHHHFHIIWPILSLLNATDYMQIGCYNYASLVTALQCVSLSRATAIDTFRGLETEKLVLKNIKEEVGDRCQHVDLVKGSSHDVVLIIRIYRKLLENHHFKGLNFLFINEIHCLEGVSLDFFNFSPLVRPHGVIVFDGYADKNHFPFIRKKVDELVDSVSSSYSIIGQPKNNAKAFGNNILTDESNEFLLSKRKITLREAKFVVCVATYERQDGSTAEKLQRFFFNLRKQVFDDWVLVVIGDRYENAEEFFGFRDLFEPDRAYFLNLPVACERDDPILRKTPRQLWCSGGCTAFNYGLMLCNHFDNAEIYVHGDDDDVWESNHLKALAEVYAETDASFVWTKGVHTDGKIYPPEDYCQQQSGELKNGYLRLYPACGQTLHSTVSWNFHTITLRYRVVDNFVTDADMWRRITEHMKTHELISILNPICTVHHLSEGK